MSTVLTDKQTMANLSRNLKYLLADRGMSQAQLGRLTKDGEMNTSRYVRGVVMPGAGALARMAEALGVSTEMLVVDKFEKVS